MDKEKISVIIPCYNVEKFIRKTVESVLRQNYNNFEIILVDDGSKDNTLLELKKLEKRDTRVKVYFQKNKGVSAARNFGLKQISGKYIYFLDGDDFIKEELFFRVVTELQEKKVDMFSFGFEMINEYGKTLKTYPNDTKNGIILSNKELLEKVLLRKVNLNISSFIFEKKLLKNIRFLEGVSYGEDIDFIRKILIRNLDKKSIIFNDIYFYYLKRKGSAMNSKIKISDLEMCFFREQKYHNEIPNFFKTSHNYECIIEFFSILKMVAKNGYLKKDYLEMKSIFKKNDYILKEIKNLKIKKIEKNKLLLLRVLYKINLKIIIFILKKI